MKIAATYDNGQIFQHFGQTRQFKIYDIEDKAIKSSEIIGAGEYAHESLVTLLKAQGVETLICGGIGPGAQQFLKANGIQIMAGCSGEADDCVTSYLNGTLQYTDDPTCDHSGHHHHHHHFA
ncbi:MAG: NifB/NifX family molybdenum-iron cluster-binding protein [Anaerovoracaceae bacterium]|nr:NifB/NifX family molybdenum-iron cluster-binding protein [Bacillota bacterium]MDY2670655.1 NifB/NifX family molybdenum-iron cluster-binding protein [Anaerovoracaceae bacterium]